MNRRIFHIEVNTDDYKNILEKIKKEFTQRWDGKIEIKEDIEKPIYHVRIDTSNGKRPRMHHSLQQKYFDEVTQKLAHDVPHTDFIVTDDRVEFIKLNNTPLYHVRIDTSNGKGPRMHRSLQQKYFDEVKQKLTHDFPYIAFVVTDERAEFIKLDDGDDEVNTESVSFNLSDYIVGVDLGGDDSYTVYSLDYNSDIDKTIEDLTESLAQTHGISSRYMEEKHDSTTKAMKKLHDEYEGDLPSFIEDVFKGPPLCHGIGSGLELYPYQANAIDEFEDNDITMVSGARRMGVTMMGVWYAAAKALINPHYNTVILYDRDYMGMTRELYKNFMKCFEAAVENIDGINGISDIVDVDYPEKSVIKLANGGQILFLHIHNYDRMKGRSIDLLLSDNCGYGCKYDPESMETLFSRGTEDFRAIFLNTGMPESNSTFDAMCRKIARGHFSSSLSISTIHLPWYVGVRRLTKHLKSQANVIGKEAWKREYDFESPFTRAEKEIEIDLAMKKAKIGS